MSSSSSHSPWWYCLVNRHGNSMYSWPMRLNCMFGYFSSLIMAFAILVGLSGRLLERPLPPISLHVNQVKLTRGIEDMFMNQMTNLVEFNLSLDADFTSTFHWNTKQLVLFLVLEYSTDKYARSEITIWDRIITRADNKKLSINKLRNKYAINDPHELLQGQDVTLKLYWNTVPHVGALFDTQRGDVKATIPSYATR